MVIFMNISMFFLAVLVIFACDSTTLQTRKSKLETQTQNPPVIKQGLKKCAACDCEASVCVHDG